MLTLLFSLLLLGMEGQQYQSSNLDNIIESGTIVPASCIGNKQFNKTNAATGENFYLCVNGVFVQQIGGGGTGTALAQAAEYDAANAVSVSAGASGRAVVQTPVRIDPTTGTIINANADPTEIEWKWQTGTLAAGAAGKTNTGMSTAGVPVWRAYGGAEKTVASVDQIAANPVTAAAVLGSGTIPIGDGARGVAASTLDASVTKLAKGVPSAAVASDVTGLFSGTGDYLKSDGTKGTPGGGSIDLGTLALTDDFTSNGAGLDSGGEYGALRWKVAVSGTVAVGYTSSSALRDGWVSLDPYAAANNSATIHLAGYNFSAPWFYAPTTGWEFQFVVRSDLYETTELTYRIGLIDAADATPSDGIWFRYVTNSACTTTGTDSVWTYETRASNTPTTSTASGVALATATIYKFRMRSIEANKVKFSMCSGSAGCTLGSETEITTNIPTAMLTPAFQAIGCATTTYKKLAIDSFAAMVTK